MNHRPSKMQTTLLAALLPLALAACAPDAWNASDPYGDFLTQVRNKCWDTRIGRTDIPQLMPLPSQVDDYFMDLTSRLYSGKITVQSYRSTLGAFYDAPPDASGIECILSLLPPRAPDPLQPPEIIPPKPAGSSR